MSAPTTPEHPGVNPERPASPETTATSNDPTVEPRPALAGQAAQQGHPRAEQVPPKVKNAIIAGGVGLAVGFGLLGFGAGYVVGHDNSSGQNQMRGPGMNGGGMPGMNGGQMPGMNGGAGQNGQSPFGGPGQQSDGQAPNGQAPNGQAPNGQAPNGQVPDGQAPNGQVPNGQAGQGATQTS
ncbi:hypothetical protein [Gordonia aichiensis]